MTRSGANGAEPADLLPDDVVVAIYSARVRSAPCPTAGGGECTCIGGCDFAGTMSGQFLVAYENGKVVVTKLAKV